MRKSSTALLTLVAALLLAGCGAQSGSADPASGSGGGAAQSTTDKGDAQASQGGKQELSINPKGHIDKAGTKLNNH